MECICSATAADTASAAVPAAITQHHERMLAKHHKPTLPAGLRCHGALPHCNSEIKKYQKSTKPLLPKAPFDRLVREVCQDVKAALAFRKDALLALQEAAEAHLVRPGGKGSAVQPSCWVSLSYMAAAHAAQRHAAWHIKHSAARLVLVLAAA